MAVQQALGIGKQGFELTLEPGFIEEVHLIRRRASPSTASIAMLRASSQATENDLSLVLHFRCVRRLTPACEEAEEMDPVSA